MKIGCTQKYKFNSKNVCCILTKNQQQKKILGKTVREINLTKTLNVNFINNYNNLIIDDINIDKRYITCTRNKTNKKT